MKLFLNPFENEIFIPVLIRLVYIFLGGFIVVVVFNLKKMNTFFQSETWKRFYGWLIMAPFFIMGIFLGPVTSVLLLIYVIYKATVEYCNILGLPHFFRNLILINGFISIALTIFYTELAFMLPALYFIIIMLASILRNQLSNILNFVAYTLFASIWICYGLTHFVLFYMHLQMGVKLLLMFAFAIALSDVMAYVIGKMFHKIGFGVNQVIARRISPNKTYAGLIGNIAGASTGVFTLRFIDTGLNTTHLLILILIISVFTIMGDLLESVVKRFAGVKDSAGSIPGHGGFLDRIDSLLVTGMACYYYFIMI